MDVDLSAALLAVHVLVGLAFVGLGIQNAVAGRPLGLVLQGLLGLLIVVAGIVASRIVGG